MPRLPRTLSLIAALGVACALIAACGSSADRSTADDVDAGGAVTPSSTTSAPSSSGTDSSGTDASGTDSSGEADSSGTDRSASPYGSGSGGTRDVTAPDEGVVTDPSAALAAGDPSTPVAGGSGGANDETLDQVDRAIAEGDLCAVYAGLTAVDLSATSTSKLREQMSRIVDVMGDARSLVPASLRGDWDRVSDGTSTMLSSLAGGRSVPDDFDLDAYTDASHRVGDWMDANCA